MKPSVKSWRINGLVARGLTDGCFISGPGTDSTRCLTSVAREWRDGWPSGNTAVLRFATAWATGPCTWCAIYVSLNGRRHYLGIPYTVTGVMKLRSHKRCRSIMASVSMRLSFSLKGLTFLHDTTIRIVAELTAESILSRRSAHSWSRLLYTVSFVLYCGNSFARACSLVVLGLLDWIPSHKKP